MTFRSDRWRRTVGIHARVDIGEASASESRVNLVVAVERQVAVGRIQHVEIGFTRLRGGEASEIQVAQCAGPVVRNFGMLLAGFDRRQIADCFANGNHEAVRITLRYQEGHLRANQRIAPV